MEVKTKLACGLQKSVGDLWRGDDFSDFTVDVQGTLFPCHRFILKACSGFFQGLFRSQMKECAENRVDLGGMTASTFEVIVNSVYKGINGITQENVLEVWSATEQLQIGYLIEECEDFVMENISVENCLEFLSHSITYWAINVTKQVLNFIIKNFYQVKNKDCFLQISFDNFYQIINSDDLVANSEDVVLETVLKWVGYNPSLGESSPTNSNTVTVSSRSQDLFPLLSACRLFVINSSYLENVLMNNNKLLSCAEAQNLVFTAYLYNMHVELRHNAGWPEAAVHRYSSSLKHVMVFASNEKLVAYNLNNKSIHEIAMLPYKNLVDRNLVVFDNTLYLEDIGAYGFDIFLFTNEKTWLPTARQYSYCHSISLAHGSYIYSLHNHKLERWNCNFNHSGKWETVYQQQPIHHAYKEVTALVRFQKYILMFTSKYNETKALCYNTETSETHATRTTLYGVACKMTSFSHQGDVFVLLRNGRLYKIVSSDAEPVDFELISELWQKEGDLYGSVLYKKQLFVFCRPSADLVTSVSINSLPGLFDRIQMVQVEAWCPCLPMTVPESWLVE